MDKRIAIRATTSEERRRALQNISLGRHPPKLSPKTPNLMLILERGPGTVSRSRVLLDPVAQRSLADPQSLRDIIQARAPSTRQPNRFSLESSGKATTDFGGGDGCVLRTCQGLPWDPTAPHPVSGAGGCGGSTGTRESSGVIPHGRLTTRSQGDRPDPRCADGSQPRYGAGTRKG